MECFTATVSYDIFMDNYFTPFRLLIHVAVNNIRGTGVLNKKRYANALLLRTNSCKKGNVATLNSAAHINQKSRATCVVG